MPEREEKRTQHWRHRRGLVTLIDLKAEKAVEPFISALRNDPDSSIRYTAALGLGYLHSDSIADALMEILQKEKVGFVRYQIIGSLGMRRARKAIPMLFGLYENSDYDIRNAILGTVSALGDSTIVPSLLKLFLIDKELAHRHTMAETIASYHTAQADEFSSALLDTSQIYWLKTAVMEGWTKSNFTKGFDQISKWTSVPCAADDNPSKEKANIQGLVFPLLRAIEKLGTPEQIALAVKAYTSCSDGVIRKRAADMLKEQLAKDIAPQLRGEIEGELRTFPSQ